MKFQAGILNAECLIELGDQMGALAHLVKLESGICVPLNCMKPTVSMNMGPVCLQPGNEEVGHLRLSLIVLAKYN